MTLGFKYYIIFVLHAEDIESFLNKSDIEDFAPSDKYLLNQYEVLSFSEESDEETTEHPRGRIQRTRGTHKSRDRFDRSDHQVEAFAASGDNSPSTTGSTNERN